VIPTLSDRVLYFRSRAALALLNKALTKTTFTMLLSTVSRNSKLEKKIAVKINKLNRKPALAKGA